MDVNGDDEWSEEEYGFRSPIEKGISLVARIFRGVVKVVKFIFMPFLYLIGGLLFFSLLASWFGLIVAGVFTTPHVDFFTYGPDALGYVAMFNAVFALGIPLLVIVLSITKFIFKFKVNKTLTVSLIVFAIINFFSFVSIAGSVAKDFNVETTQVSEFNSDRTDTDTIHFNFPRTRDLDQAFVVSLGDKMKIAEDQLLVRSVDVNMKKSADDKFSIHLEKKGRGNNSVASDDYLDHISLDIKEDNGHISIPQYFTIDRGGKYRAQEINVTVNIPEGKHFVFGRGVRSSMVNSKEMVDGYEREFRKENAVWTMTDKGIVNNLSKEELNKKEPSEMTISLSLKDGLDIKVNSDGE